ncbi:MAG: hypothetical protein ACTSQS_16705, partial [Promethearchaeota archaeon]
MSKYTSIKVSKKTLKRLHQLVRELTQQRGRRITLEDAIIQLLEQRNKIHSRESHELKIEKDRQAFLALIDEVFEGASSE